MYEELLAWQETAVYLLPDGFYLIFQVVTRTFNCMLQSFHEYYVYFI